MNRPLGFGSSHILTEFITQLFIAVDYQAPSERPEFHYHIHVQIFHGTKAHLSACSGWGALSTKI